MNGKPKVLIVFSSGHHGNTEKIAKAMAKILGAKLAKPSEINPEEIANYDLVGFGSGVYYVNFSKELLALIDKVPKQKNKKCFIFSTSGLPEIKLIHEFTKPIKRKLIEKNFMLLDSFSCRGLDTNGFFLKLIGGIRKGRPNGRDVEAAEAFAMILKQKLALS